jgi:DNA gyrase/topoisomerase IV subunit A
MAQIYMQLTKYKPVLESAKAKRISHLSIDEAIRIVREAEKDRYIDHVCERSPAVRPEIVQLSKGVLLQERDDDRYNQFVGREERLRAIRLDREENSQIEALAQQRTALLDRTDRLEAEAKELRQQADALQKQISKRLRAAFVKDEP